MLLSKFSLEFKNRQPYNEHAYLNETKFEEYFKASFDKRVKCSIVN